MSFNESHQVVRLNKTNTYYSTQTKYYSILLSYIQYIHYFCIIKLKHMLPANCPSCHSTLKVKCLKCENCQTEVTGLYDLPALALLSTEDQQFILRFVINSGSLKEMASELKLSYPTVRNMLNEIINKIKKDEE